MIPHQKQTRISFIYSVWVEAQLTVTIDSPFTVTSDNIFPSIE
jgi:hypothetical protein